MPMSGVNTIRKAGISPTAAEASEDALKWVVPACVHEQFAQRQNRFYRDRSIAFVDFGDWLRVEASGIDIISGCIEIAKARRWVIAVTGTEDFRRQAWREAVSRHLDLGGYEPTEIEKAEITAVSERHGASYSVDPAAGRPDRRDRITGLVVAFGDDGNSQFITIRRDDGQEVTKWGLDIGRARLEAEGAGGRRLAIGEGERVTFADLGVRQYRSAEGEMDLRKIFVIERVGIDFERRRAETEARFAPAKFGPGARVVDTRKRREHAPDQTAASPPKGFDSTAPAAYGSVIAGQSVTLYQPLDGTHPVGPQWWTSDHALAKRYGRKVHSATIRGEQIHDHATPFGSATGPEFLFPKMSPIEIESEGIAMLARRQGGPAQTLNDIALTENIRLAQLFAEQYHGGYQWFVTTFRQTLIAMQERGEPIPAPPREKN